MKKPKPVEDDPERLIRLSEAARMLGLSPDVLRKGYAGENSLTIVVLSRPGAQRPTLRLVRSEVIEHRRKLIEHARRRTTWFRAIERDRS